MKKAVFLSLAFAVICSSSAAFADCSKIPAGNLARQARCLVDQVIAEKSNAEVNAAIDELAKEGFTRTFGEIETLTIGFEYDVKDQSHFERVLLSRAFSRNENGAVVATKSLLIAVDVIGEGTELPKLVVKVVKLDM